MGRENAICGICSEEDLIFRQGESILFQMQLLADDDKPIDDMEKYSVMVLLVSPRSEGLIYGYNAGEDVLPIEIDKDGNMAFVVTSEQSASMLGGYALEISVANGDSRIITTAPGFEVVPSHIMKYAAQG